MEEMEEKEEKEEEGSLVQAIGSRLSRVMQRGTANHVVAEGRHAAEENVSIVAQAESTWIYVDSLCVSESVRDVYDKYAC